MVCYRVLNVDHGASVPDVFTCKTSDSSLSIRELNSIFSAENVDEFGDLLLAGEDLITEDDLRWPPGESPHYPPPSPP